MLIEHLLTHAARRSDEVAIIDDRGQYTYKQLAGMAAALAAHLAGVTDKSTVGLLLPSGAGYVAGFYAALLAGRTVVPINFLLSDRELAHVVRDSGIDTVISAPPLSAKLEGTGLKVIDVPTVVAAAAASAGAGTARPALSPAERSASDVALLMYTSGTSGLPKGVPLTYANIQADVDACIGHFGLVHQHKFLGILPLFHIFGVTAMMLAPIQLASTIVYAARFNPTAAVKAIREHGISMFGGVPSMFAAMLRLKDASADDFSSIYAILSGGEPLPTALATAFEARFGKPLLECYGMTEACLAIAANTPDAHRAGSVGRTVPGMTVRVVDDAGHDVPPGESGEFWLSGPKMTAGYHQLPAENAAAFAADGSFKTGDLGRVDSDGYLFITGRKKDLIIVAGENVSPREIEEVLGAHPAVAEAAVVGRKDESRGEVVVAFVIAKEGQTPQPDELRDFCRKQGLAQFKVPREVKVVADFPRSPTGKVLKRELAAGA